MNTTDHWDDLKAAGQVLPPSPEVLAHARSRLARRHRRTRRSLVAVLAAAGATAAVIGAVAVYRTTSTPIPVIGPTATARPTQPVPTAPTAPRSQGAAASCAYSYSVAELKKRRFAFDGTVLSAAPEPGRGRLPTYAVTFAINEWFSSGKAPEQVVLVMHRAPGNTDLPREFGPEYSVGSRLLITGDLIDPTHQVAEPPVVWGCGFSRLYNPTDAATWRKAFAK